MDLLVCRCVCVALNLKIHLIRVIATEQKLNFPAHFLADIQLRRP